MQSLSAELSRAALAPNPMHCGACGDGAWSTINAGEALPGVVTPLTWSFYGNNTERAMRGCFADLGVLREADCVAPEAPDARLWDVFYGRAAANLETFRWLGDRMPGTSGDAVEEQIFGSVRPGVRSERVLSRYPVVAAKLPWAAARVAARLRQSAGGITPWWTDVIAAGGPTSADAARVLLRDAARRHEAVMRPHCLAAMLCQGLYDQILQLAEAARLPGLETSLVTGYGDMAETEVVSDLWSVSRRELSLDEFIVRHGFHGPNEGELAARVWRMRREPLERLVATYSELDDDRAPRRIEAQRGEERRRAEAQLLAALPRPRRAHAKVVLGLAARLIPLRGVGKAAFLRCSDVARVSARAMGERLDVLDDPDDVFMLTVEELLAPALSPNAGDVARVRRTIHDEYRAIELPEVWEGMPTVRGASAPHDGAAGQVSGAAVSPGVVEGIARVIHDADGDEDLEPGEILVCRTTDPSWASLMLVAGALVIDIGGAISHGAIVARELGIPCVIGTRNGSSVIRTGDRLRVDGSAGTVHVIEGALPSAAAHPTT